MSKFFSHFNYSKILVVCASLYVHPLLARQAIPKANLPLGKVQEDRTKSKGKPQQPNFNSQFNQFIEQYKRGKLSKSEAWVALEPFAANMDKLNLTHQSTVLYLRSQLLFNSGYPHLAADYAAQTLMRSQAPYLERNSQLWNMLWSIAKEKPIQDTLEDLAANLKASDNQGPPKFRTNWHYVRGNVLQQQSKDREAMAAYEAVVMQDHYFIPSQYQLAMLSIKQKNFAKAETHFRTILSDTVQKLSQWNRSSLNEVRNYAVMGLARLAYQSSRFTESVREYRRIPRTSKLFYNALFEQSWALFMTGATKHALGTLYGVNSPYFANRFNPEAKVLESIMYYWMCRYDDARQALVEFSEQHNQAIISLSTFLERQRLSPEMAYNLFENYIVGVSEESIGIPMNILDTATNSDSMMLVRERYASYLEEKNLLNKFGIFGSKNPQPKLNEILDRRISNARLELGSTFLRELRNLRTHFEELQSQSEFLYLELLMSQKEQLLGRELHSDTKLTKVTDKDAFAGWSRKTQSWQDNKAEYWWDELGYHIIDIEPECKL